MTDELWQAFIQIAGAVNALLLGCVLVFSPRLHRTRSRKKLGWAFVAYAYLLLSFTAVDNFWIPAPWWIWLIDYTVVLLASALFLDYMADALGREPVSRAWYLAPVLFLLLSALQGQVFVVGVGINVVIFIQISYSCVTTWLFISSNRKLATRPHHLLALLIGLWALHVFQLGLIVAPDVNWVFDAVPLVGAALMLALTVLVLTDSRTLRNLTQVVRAPAELPLSAHTVDRFMRAERPHLDPGLSLHSLAAALGITGRELSQLISSAGGRNFYQFVNAYRIDEARQLLADPAERRTSVEAIGLMAGFRSRSTFYDAFRRELGQTPAQFRDALEKA